MHITNLEELEVLIAKVKDAQQEYARFSQEQVDHVFKQAALAANAARIPLAKMAVAETGMGIVEDKVIKNHFASEISTTSTRKKRPAASSRNDQNLWAAKNCRTRGHTGGDRAHHQPHFHRSL
jgi:acetaldehyde dehydrogenase/alcohol dehydrogenase